MNSKIFLCKCPLISHCVVRLLTWRSYKVIKKDFHGCGERLTVGTDSLSLVQWTSWFSFQVPLSYNKTTLGQFTSNTVEPHSKPQREVSVGPWAWLLLSHDQDFPVNSKTQNCLSVVQYLQIPHMTQRKKDIREEYRL